MKRWRGGQKEERVSGLANEKKDTYAKERVFKKEAGGTRKRNE